MNEKNETLISVIVPVYNVEEYLPQCVESIMSQTYRNIEILLIDDGSTDASGVLCDKYAERDSRIRVYHKENGGLSDARNYGTEMASGIYAAFIDSDDYVSDDYIEYLLHLKEKYNADISIGNMGGGRIDRELTMNASDALIRMMYIDGFGVSACGKLYNLDVLRKFPYPLGKVYEDLATTYKIIGACKLIVYGSREIYFYRYRANSIRHRPISKENLYGLEVAKAELEYMERFYPEASGAAQFRCGLVIIDLMTGILKGGRAGKELFYSLQTEIKHYSRSILNNTHVKMKFKIRIVAIMMGYWPMRIVFSVTEGIKQIRNALTE